MSVKNLQQVHDRLTTRVLGSEKAATLLLVALLARGHALIEGAPGIGKTSLAQALAGCFGGCFKRIQFTPDLLPSDILGYHLYRQKSESFEFITGPVFTNLLLADEINRTSPRVQSALLEVMNESQVTVDGETHPLPDPFVVIATQNSIFNTGTFPLPESQLDRFLLSIPMSLPAKSVQEKILLGELEEVVDEQALICVEDVVSLQKKVSEIAVSSALSSYIVSLCDGIRQRFANENAVSIRASLALLHSAQAYALINDSEYVLPDHVQYVFANVMTHRMMSDASIEKEDILYQVLEQTPVA